jgi:hypothetical protein
MPSTFTTILELEKPATGEQVDTWGPTVNANYDVIDALFENDADPRLKISAGGTGANTAEGARTALGLDDLVSNSGNARFCLDGESYASFFGAFSPAPVDGVIIIGTVGGAPTQLAGGQLYVHADGSLRYLSPNGTSTTLGAA